MTIGPRLRALREEKQLSQGDIEKRTGLLRSYISRIENDYTIPSLETLEKMARALEVEMYQLFYDGEKPSKPPQSEQPRGANVVGWPSGRKDPRYLIELRRLLADAPEFERKLILQVARKIVGTSSHRGGRATNSAGPASG